MPRNKYTDRLKEARAFHLDRTGNLCELCRLESSPVISLALYFIDRDPGNLSPSNIAVFCTPCAAQFNRQNPEGLNIKNGCFAFAMNRGLYEGQIETDYPAEAPRPPYVKSKRAIRRGARKKRSQAGAGAGGRSTPSR